MSYISHSGYILYESTILTRLSQVFTEEFSNAAHVNNYCALLK